MIIMQLFVYPLFNYFNKLSIQTEVQFLVTGIVLARI